MVPREVGASPRGARLPHLFPSWSGVGVQNWGEAAKSMLSMEKLEAQRQRGLRLDHEVEAQWDEYTSWSSVFPGPRPGWGRHGCAGVLPEGQASAPLANPCKRLLRPVLWALPDQKGVEGRS